MKKKDRRDRKDGYYVKDADDINKFMPYLLPSRIERQLYVTLNVDATNILTYLAERKSVEGNNVTLYTTIISALVRTIAIRPRLNRFVKGYRIYQREKIHVGHIGMVSFEDNSERTVKKIVFTPEADIFEISTSVTNDIKSMRSGEESPTEDTITKLANAPRFYTRFICWVNRFLSFHGWSPKKFTEGDPYHSTFFISNLGSIKCTPPIHHLTEFGTNSLFVTMGPLEDRPAVVDGEIVIRPFIDIIITLDDGIAGGYYFSTALKVFEELLDNPRLLEQRYVQEVEQ